VERSAVVQDEVGPPLPLPHGIRIIKTVSSRKQNYTFLKQLDANCIGPSLVSRITSYSVDRSIEATAYPSLKGTGSSPYMTRGHLELA
jgi:hypothetical protein